MLSQNYDYKKLIGGHKKVKKRFKMIEINDKQFMNILNFNQYNNIVTLTFNKWVILYICTKSMSIKPHLQWLT